MLKISVLALMFAGAALPAFAQSVSPAPAATAPYQHCILVSSGDGFNGSDVRLEYGQRGKTPVQDAQLAQDNRAIAQLGAVVPALNYMSTRGWDCISVSVLTTKSNAYAGTTYSQTGYLLRRRAPEQPTKN